MRTAGWIRRASGPAEAGVDHESAAHSRNRSGRAGCCRDGRLCQPLAAAIGGGRSVLLSLRQEAPKHLYGSAGAHRGRRPRGQGFRARPACPDRVCREASLGRRIRPCGRVCGRCRFDLHRPRVDRTLSTEARSAQPGSGMARRSRRSDRRRHEGKAGDVQFVQLVGTVWSWGGKFEWDAPVR